MSNRKKIKIQDGDSRIVSMNIIDGFCEPYKLQVYDKSSHTWKDLQGCDSLTLPEAVIARKNYTALRKACKIANKSVLRIQVPEDEGHRN